RGIAARRLRRGSDGKSNELARPRGGPGGRPCRGRSLSSPVSTRYARADRPPHHRGRTRAMNGRLRRRWSTRLALLLLTLAGDALADRIAVLRPRSDDPAILSAFAHLQGELALHDFEVVVVDAAGDASVPDGLAITTQREGAQAGVSLLRSNDG